ncbi:ABC transporter permease [Adhaeribacter aerolatus]|uniref:ABC transporter permease n=1 Tax=Adhaeribacter aerolatus TaxID=670289 RepID=A0A512AYQ7_9BACT|nr:ABC transporter permease [Adhaeribacter aerolatus]GEO04851.1 ABC transporter permease [Adhaeribacter aerolatus]
MLKNYFKIAWRNLRRNKIYSAINILGLATGISACILIFLFVQDELTYERHFSQADRIVRVVSSIRMQENLDKFAYTPFKLAQTIGDNYPAAETVTKILPIGKQTLWVAGKAFNQENLFFADSNFFKVFDYPFLLGNPETALKAPKTIVLTEDLAIKLFGSTAAAMGQMLQFSKNEHLVTGVVANPQHSHLQPEGFLSAITLGKGSTEINAPTSITNWLALNWYTYVLLKDKNQIPALQQQLFDLSRNTINPWIKENELTASQTFYLQPIRDIHLNPEWKDQTATYGQKAYVYIFSFVAIFLLLIACINYMNLATARSAKRAREVGLRKVVGAYRSQIVRQFIGESILITLFAVLLALALVEILLPPFNTLTNKNFSYTYFTEGSSGLVLLGIVVFVGLVAGSYPAFFLSGFKPAEVLKSDKSPQGSNALLRKFLVVLQFTISLILIIGTLVVYSQMQFIKNANLGFKKEQVFVIDIPVGDTTLIRKLPHLKQELLNNPAVAKVANAANIPGGTISDLITLIEKDGKQEERTSFVLAGDYDFLDLLGISVLEGRNFSRETPTDLKGGVLVNQAMVRKMGWQDSPIGKRILFSDWDAKVIGVVNDFHYTSLHTTIDPLIIALAPTSPGYLLVRVNTTNLPATLRFVQEKWKAFDPNHPIEYFFLDEYFNQQYRTEDKMLTIFGYFAALTIIIACLGLFGLTSFTAEQRTREIGIRKVLGSSVADIMMLLSRDFALLVIISIALATPIAWYGMHRWLQDFAYRTPLSLWTFLIAGVFAMVIAMLTVSLQAAKAATANPIKALRSE